MKKNFALQATGKADARVVESVKSEIRKYVKRERRKPVAEGVDFWDFNCKVGRDLETATTKSLPEVAKAIDDFVNAGATKVYVEILATPGHRPKRPPLTEAVP